MFGKFQENRFERLARHLDKLADQDRLRAEQEKRIFELRRKAAMDLHGVCAEFVGNVNTFMRSSQLELSPTQFAPELYRDTGANVFQISLGGRIVQVLFRPTPTLLAAERLRAPYTLEGSVQWFSQAELDRDSVDDDELYYVVDDQESYWRIFDRRTHKLASFDAEYLSTVLEELL